MLYKQIPYEKECCMSFSRSNDWSVPGILLHFELFRVLFTIFVDSFRVYSRYCNNIRMDEMGEERVGVSPMSICTVRGWSTAMPADLNAIPPMYLVRGKILECAYRIKCIRSTSIPRSTSTISFVCPSYSVHYFSCITIYWWLFRSI